MKLNTTTKDTPFTPITISITIESQLEKDALLSLSGRYLSIPNLIFFNRLDQLDRHDDLPMWSIINNLLQHINDTLA